MKWPPRKHHTKGNRVVSQRQSHRANIHRVFRQDDDPNKREVLSRLDLEEAQRSIDRLDSGSS